VRSLQLKVTAAVLIVMSSVAAGQTTYTCSGVPRGVSMGASGTLTVESLGGLTWPYLCSVDGAQNGISPGACKAIYAGLLAAQASGRSVTIWFTNSASTCAANPAWAWALGAYLWRFDN